MSQTISYSQYVLTQEPGFIGRISSILKDEGFSKPGEASAEQAGKLAADVAAQPGIAESYHGAVLSARDDAATADDVITDGALLSAVTAVVNSLPQEG